MFIWNSNLTVCAAVVLLNLAALSPPHLTLLHCAPTALACMLLLRHTSLSTSPRACHCLIPPQSAHRSWVTSYHANAVAQHIRNVFSYCFGSQSRKWRCWQGWLPPQALERNPFRPLPASALWFLDLWPHPSLCLCLHGASSATCVCGHFLMASTPLTTVLLSEIITVFFSFLPPFLLLCFPSSLPLFLPSFLPQNIPFTVCPALGYVLGYHEQPK